MRTCSVFSCVVSAREVLTFEMLFHLAAYGKVFLVRKRGGYFSNNLYAMKVLKKATIVQKAKTAEHTRTERQVLEAVRRCPFLVTLHWAFQTESKLHLIMGMFAAAFVRLYPFITAENFKRNLPSKSYMIATCVNAIISDKLRFFVSRTVIGLISRHTSSSDHTPPFIFILNSHYRLSM